MPSLTPDEQNRMLGRQETCRDCGQVVSKNYCRQCDEFYWEGHKQDCPRMAPGPFSQDHSGHRTY